MFLLYNISIDVSNILMSTAANPSTCASTNNNPYNYNPIFKYVRYAGRVGDINNKRKQGYKISENKCTKNI